MITTRGKDNISDVGRQKCVIIILVYAYFQFDWKRRMSYLPMFCATFSLNALCKQMRTEETSCSFEYKLVWELCLFLMLPGSLKTFPVLSVSTACHCDVMWFQIPEFFGIKNAYLCNLLYVNTFFIFFTFERFNPTGMYFQVLIICVFSYQYSSGVHNNFSRFCWFVAPQPFWYTLLASMVFFLMEKESWSKTIKCVSFNSLYILLILLDMK